MSQQLIPLNNGVVPQVQTTVTQDRLNVLSSIYIDVNNLHSRPTEWVPGGRPIYRRLPATSETYQINFFNFVANSNVLSLNENIEGIEKVGYVYLPYGENINGPISVEVVAADGDKALLVKGGVVIWEYGKDDVLPTIIDIRTLDIGSGQYDLAYQLIYDDSPVPKLYAVEDFSLVGQPLNITSSTDSIVGWRFPAVNAFLNNPQLRWSNEDTFFQSCIQPNESFLQWVSSQTAAYSDITLRLPPGSAYNGTATLQYVNGSAFSEVATVDVSTDANGQFFKFVIDSPVLQTGWNIAFSSPKVSVQSITVSGTVTILERPSAPSPLTQLVMYPVGLLPPTVTVGNGSEVPATYCRLAIVDIGSSFNILRVDDQRTIIHRDYVPVADWLTLPFDENLIYFYNQAQEYPRNWMDPTTSLKQEYVTLESKGITVEA
jgi:hypothetical protein